MYICTSGFLTALSDGAVANVAGLHHGRRWIVKGKLGAPPTVPNINTVTFLELLSHPEYLFRACMSDPRSDMLAPISSLVSVTGYLCCLIFSISVRTSRVPPIANWWPCEWIASCPMSPPRYLHICIYGVHVIDTYVSYGVGPSGVVRGLASCSRVVSFVGKGMVSSTEMHAASSMGIAHVLLASAAGQPVRLAYTTIHKLELGALLRRRWAWRVETVFLQDACSLGPNAYVL